MSSYDTIPQAVATIMSSYVSSSVVSRFSTVDSLRKLAVELTDKLSKTFIKAIREAELEKLEKLEK